MQNSYTHCWAVILAGGSGSRFWPKSRIKQPKQLCKLGSQNKTMLELTLDRLDNFIPPERRIIVTHDKQFDRTKKIVSQKCKYIIAEPSSKNTAAALNFAAMEIKQLTKSNPKTTMVSLHADHIISPTNEFIDTLHKAIEIAQLNYLTLIGIKPNCPATGFGYLQKGNHLTETETENAYHVAKFCEKPNVNLAKEYYKNSQFHWNSGIFIWKIDIILEALASYLPDTHDVFSNFYKKYPSSHSTEKTDGKIIEPYYEQLKNVAIDHAVLEKSKNIAMIESKINWQDIGVWTALKENFPVDQKNNYISGDILTIETENCVIDSDDDCFIATLGIKDLVIVKSQNGILVCHKDRAQDVKSIVENLKQRERYDLL